MAGTLPWTCAEVLRQIRRSKTQLSIIDDEFFLEVILVIVPPVLYASGVSWAFWSGFSRPWLFAFSSVALLYFLYFIVLYFGAPSGGGFVLEVPHHGEPSRQAFLLFLEP